MNFNRKEDQHDSDNSNSHSSDSDDYSPKFKNENDGNFYEDASSSDTDEKETLDDRMNDVGVIDVTYAQRTVWLVKVRNIRRFICFKLIF